MGKLIVGNWKMNGTRAALSEATALAEALRARKTGASAHVVGLCPPATLITAMAHALDGGPVQVGGQDCHVARAGAHTGDISAEQLADAGAVMVIIGHSERRQDHGETSATVRAKVEAAWAAGLRAIVCVGESGAQRQAGQTLAIIDAQVRESLPKAPSGKLIPDHLVVAYEPVWAIGTGLVPEPSDIIAVHALIRGILRDLYGAAAGAIPILYGGSVKPDNARALLGLANVDGALVGGASLQASEFIKIIDAA